MIKAKAVFSMRPAHCRTFTEGMGSVELCIEMRGFDRDDVTAVADELGKRLQLDFLYLEDEES